MERERLAFLEKQIATMKDSLTKSDQKIVAYIRLHPEDFARLSAVEISRTVDTSIAAITRFTRKMGYERLQELKLAVARDLESSRVRPYRKQYEGIEENDGLLMIAQKVLQKNVESIRDIEKMLRQDHLERALEIIRGAHRLIFTGLGGSASVAQDGYHKFMRLGMMVELITDVQTQGIVASVGGEKDAIIVVSNEGANTELNMALKIAKENGIRIIAITQFTKSPLAQIADVCLYTLSREFDYKPEPLISRIAEYSLIDVLYVSFCARSQERLEENLVKISNNIKLFKNYSN